MNKHTLFLLKDDKLEQNPVSSPEERFTIYKSANSILKIEKTTNDPLNNDNLIIFRKVDLDELCDHIDSYGKILSTNSILEIVYDNDFNIISYDTIIGKETLDNILEKEKVRIK